MKKKSLKVILTSYKAIVLLFDSLKINLRTYKPIKSMYINTYNNGFLSYELGDFFIVNITDNNTYIHDSLLL